MNFTPIPSPIIKKNDDIFVLLCTLIKEQNIKIDEFCIFIISSKIVALSQGRVENIKSKADKKQFIENESDEILVDKGDFALTVTNGIIIANAGIDSSNTKSNTIILWPKNPQHFADVLREKLRAELDIGNIGIIISDSRISPMRRGTTGVALAWSGIIGIQDLRGEKDIFGNTLQVSTVNIVDNLVSGAEVLMGQADEKTPFVIIEKLDHKYFTHEQQDPKDAIISKDEDLFFQSSALL